MLIDGFLAVTAVLEPHLLFLPAPPPDSASTAAPSGLAATAEHTASKFKPQNMGPQKRCLQYQRLSL